MAPMIWVWMVISLFFTTLEALTTALVAVWFIFGAVAAMLGTFFELNVVAQIFLFVVVSSLLLFFTRPIIRRRFPLHFVPTDAGRLLNYSGKVIEQIDNRKASGTVFVDGKTWCARSMDDTVVPAGITVKVVKVEGAKILVRASSNLPSPTIQHR